MAVNYTVLAQVVDLRMDKPRSGEFFLVDTNVWFWTTYGRVGLASKPPRPYQTREYPRYLRRALASGARLHWCGLGLSELAHQIERTEYNVWNDTQVSAGGMSINPKEFRHNLPAERANVVQEIETAWQAVEAIGSILPAPLVVDAASTTQALAEFKTTALDGYDLFFLQAARASNVTQIISDDGDFCGVAGITLFTSNKTVLTAAQAQGKLLAR